jgi:hypothetical protein
VITCRDVVAYLAKVSINSPRRLASTVFVALGIPLGVNREQELARRPSVLQIHVSFSNILKRVRRIYEHCLGSYAIRKHEHKSKGPSTAGF